MASLLPASTLRALRLVGAFALGLALLPAAAHAREMDLLLAQLMTDPEPEHTGVTASRGVQAAEAAPRGARATEPAARGGTACVAGGPGGELVIRAQPGCSMEATANVVRLAAAALDVPRQTPECRRIGHCRPSRSFTRLHALASLAYERGRLGGPRYWGQQY